MKKAVVSLAAVLVLLASFATPSFAAGTSNSASNSKCSIRVSGPATAAAGETVRFTGTITLINDGTSSRKPVIYELGISSNGGPVERIPLRSGVKTMNVGSSKTATRSITINDRVTPGDYVVYLQVTVDGEPLVVSLPITITK
ncbi:MAG TPA: hypothetical protein PLF26_04310 [Blastocatellia bacterium]|nr:hypothetical protein [Blastocatellia bacterium]